MEGLIEPACLPALGLRLREPVRRLRCRDGPYCLPQLKCDDIAFRRHMLPIKLTGVHDQTMVANV